MENEKESVGMLVAVNYESDAFMDAWDLKDVISSHAFRRGRISHLFLNSAVVPVDPKLLKT